MQLAALHDFAARVPEGDRPGIDVFAERLRAEQDEGNRTLAAALEHAESMRLRERLRELVAVDEPEPEAVPEHNGHPGSEW